MVQNEEREHVPQISVMLKIIGEKGFDLFSDHPFESEPWRNGLNSCRSWICEAFSGRWHWSCSMWFLWYITLILLVWYDIWNSPPRSAIHLPKQWRFMNVFSCKGFFDIVSSCFTIHSGEYQLFKGIYTHTFYTYCWPRRLWKLDTCCDSQR